MHPTSTTGLTALTAIKSATFHISRSAKSVTREPSPRKVSPPKFHFRLRAREKERKVKAVPYFLRLLVPTRFGLVFGVSWLDGWMDGWMEENRDAM